MIYTAIAAAEAAGEMLRRAFGQDVQVNEMLAHDVKIQADIDTQQLITDIILDNFPDHKIIGEEGNAGNPDGNVEWVIDPIDGTMNFAMGIPHFCISIAAQEGGNLLLGVVYDPMRDEMFTTRIGQATILNGKKLRVSPRNRLQDAVLSMGFSKSKESIDRCLNLYKFYGPNCRKTRSMGSAALDMAYVAAGRLDAYIESSVNWWDIAAGKILIENAGGHVDVEEKLNGKVKVVATSGNIEFPMT